MTTHVLPDRVVDRPTIGIVMRAFDWPDYDIWLAATQAAREQDLNVVTFVGRCVDSPESLRGKPIPSMISSALRSSAAPLC